MKIKPEHYLATFNAIDALPKDRVETHYENLIELQKIKPHMNLDVRFRWDCFWATKFDCKDIYSYADDSNIDTALKKIVQKLNLGKKI
jgi:hypothetical protein